MGKIYLEKDVLTASLDRLEYVFKNFDNIYFSFSGGKDSSLMLQLANIVAKKMKKKFDVLFIDLEAQYKLTIEHVEELKNLSRIRDFYHISLPLALRNSVSILQPKWMCWDENSKDLWIRELPFNCINISNCNIAIRANESLNRFRTIAKKIKKVMYKDVVWSSRIKYKNYFLILYFLSLTRHYIKL